MPSDDDRPEATRRSANVVIFPLLARDGEDLAHLNHDPDRISTAVVDNAVKIQMEIFADPYGEAGKILVTLASSTYSALRAEPRFMAACEGANWAEALTRLGRIEGTVDTIREAIERTRRELLDAIRATLPAEAQARGVPDQPRRHVVGQARAAPRVEAKFDRARDLVDVLPAGPRGANERLDDLGLVNEKVADFHAWSSGLSGASRHLWPRRPYPAGAVRNQFRGSRPTHALKARDAIYNAESKLIKGPRRFVVASPGPRRTRASLAAADKLDEILL